MRDEQLDAAIDDVAQEMTSGTVPEDFSTRVVSRIEPRPARTLSRWWLAAPAALVGAVMVAAMFQRSNPQPSVAPAVMSRSLVWVDREGHETPIPMPLRAYESFRLSPDGTRLALGIRDEEDDIWVWEFSRQTLTRLTFDPALDVSPIWTPDARRIVFASARGGVLNLFWQAADGSGAAERLTTNPNVHIPQSFSPDGRSLIFQEVGPASESNLFRLILGGPQRIEPLTQSSFVQRKTDVSPDGRWLVYESNESGRAEIYVRPFLELSAGRWQLSTRGGTSPRWRRDGREILYLNDGKVMAVSVAAAQRSFAAIGLTELFEGPYVDDFDVSLDGQRLVMIKDR